jgi:hypothetical protein
MTRTLGDPSHRTSATYNRKDDSWPAKVRMYCGVQSFAIGSLVGAMLCWTVLDNGAVAMLAPLVLTTLGATFFASVRNAPFLDPRVVSVTWVGHVLIAAMVALVLMAPVAPDVFRGVPVELLVFGWGVGLLSAFALTTLGLLRLLTVMTGPWHGHAERSLWACLAVTGGSLLLRWLADEIRVSGPGGHKLTAGLFVVLGLAGGSFGVLLVLQGTLLRLRRACEPIDRAIWTDANGATVETIELRGGQSLVCDGGRERLESSLDATRRLNREGYRRGE